MTVLDRVPLDAITGRAASVSPGKVLLAWATAAATALAGVLWLIGWLAGKTVRGVWLAVVYAGAAIAVGWSDGTGRTKAKDGDG